MFQPANIKPKKIDCLDLLQFQGLHFHKHAFTEIISAAFTLDINDNGKILLIDTTGIFTLPAVNTKYGPYTFVNYGEEAAATGISDVQITIAPNSNDRMSGCDITALEDKDIVNTLATAKRGDYITLAYGDGDGWSIVAMGGVWTRQT